MTISEIKLLTLEVEELRSLKKSIFASNKPNREHNAKLKKEWENKVSMLKHEYELKRQKAYKAWKLEQKELKKEDPTPKGKNPTFAWLKWKTSWNPPLPTYLSLKPYPPSIGALFDESEARTRDLNLLTPQEWRVRVDRLEEFKHETARVIWWDFFASKGVTERFDHFDIYLTFQDYPKIDNERFHDGPERIREVARLKKIEENEEENIIVNLCKVGYLPFQAWTRLKNKQ